LYDFAGSKKSVCQKTLLSFLSFSSFSHGTKKERDSARKFIIIIIIHIHRQKRQRSSFFLLIPVFRTFFALFDISSAAENGTQQRFARRASKSSTIPQKTQNDSKKTMRKALLLRIAGMSLKFEIFEIIESIKCAPPNLRGFYFYEKLRDFLIFFALLPKISHILSSFPQISRFLKSFVCFSFPNQQKWVISDYQQAIINNNQLTKNNEDDDFVPDEESTNTLFFFVLVTKKGRETAAAEVLLLLCEL
jgi:hypothetical protein